MPVAVQSTLAWYVSPRRCIQLRRPHRPRPRFLGGAMSLGASCSRGQSSEVSRRRFLYCRASYTQREVRPALWDGASAIHPDGGWDKSAARASRSQSVA